ncbi:MAG TPA: hypothetical protein VFJ30_17600 [Phycisphaerae bacterium]|nr:hypothetical protein [Phycisphaerae bacterium]
MSNTRTWTVAVVLLTAGIASAGLLSVPKDYTPDKAWPVVVSTQDNPAPERMKETPYFVVHAGGKGAQCTAAIRSDLTALAGKYNIDPFRIYGTGFSRGGQEILIQAWRHPHWFAAIAPVCSDLREKPDRNRRDLCVKYLLNVPTLMLHGEGDNFRDTGQIEFDLMKQAGCDVTWKVFPGGHSPARPFKEDVKLLTDFFDKHKLNPWPKRVVHIVEGKQFSRAFWVDAVLVKDAADQRAVFDVQVGKDNRIEVKADELIASLDLYLSEKLLDMAKPVTVAAGDKTLYTGPAKPMITVKLREGAKYERTAVKPLWQELTEIRAKAKAAPAAKERPAAAKATDATGPRTERRTAPTPAGTRRASTEAPAAPGRPQPR